MININDIKPTAKFTSHISEFEQDGKFYLLNKTITIPINLRVGTHFEVSVGVYTEILDIEYHSEKGELTVSYKERGKIKKKRLAYLDEIWVAWVMEV